MFQKLIDVIVYFLNNDRGGHITLFGWEQAVDGYGAEPLGWRFAFAGTFLRLTGNVSTLIWERQAAALVTKFAGSEKGLLYQRVDICSKGLPKTK